MFQKEYILFSQNINNMNYFCEEGKNMKKIVAVNASPRTNWNTAQLVKEAGKGVESVGIEIEYFDLYKLEKFTVFWRCYCWL